MTTTVGVKIHNNIGDDSVKLKNDTKLISQTESK